MAAVNTANTGSRFRIRNPKLKTVGEAVSSVIEVIDSLPIPASFCDADGHLRHYNDHAAQLWGLAPACGPSGTLYCGAIRAFELDGSPLDLRKSAVAQALDTGEPVRGRQAIVERPDGTRSHVIANADPLRNEHGQIVGVLNVICDLSLAQTEDLLRGAIDAAPSFIIVLDPDRRVLLMNRAAERASGYSRTELAGRDFREIANLGEAEPGMIQETEWRSRSGDARIVRWSRTQVRLVTLPKLCTLLTGNDVTERRQAELERDHAFAIVNSSQDAIIGKDLNGIVTSWNPAAEQIFGYTREEMIGQPLAVLAPPDRINEMKSILQLIRNGERVEHYDTVRRRKNGTLIHVSLTVSPIRDYNGRIVGASKIARDITERRLAEEALFSQAAELARSNRELRQFAYIASHDLQEPLRGIKIFSQLLARRYHSQLDETADGYIGNITTGVDRMAAIIQDLITYSTVSQDPTELQEAETAEAIRIALRNLRSLIKETALKVEYGELPQIRANRMEMVHLFQNLIENAGKYRREGEPPRVRITADETADLWQFKVADNGIGIPSEARETVFGIFKRLHGRRIPGTGIGLALCRRIVEKHGGRIWVESQDGEGSTFCFTIAKRCEPVQAAGAAL